MRTVRRGEEGVVIREKELLLNAPHKWKKKEDFQQFSASGLGLRHVNASVHPVSKPSADHTDGALRGGEGFAGGRSDVALIDRSPCVFRNERERPNEEFNCLSP